MSEPVSERCPATLEHVHGDSTCRLPVGHDGEHEGICWTCSEDGEHEFLGWEHEHESWFKGSDTRT